MRYPDFLQKNGTIGFVAPSFGCAAEPYRSAFDNAQKKFQALGYSCALGGNCYAASGIGISNTPALCGQELTQMYCSEDSDVLISCGGGELMCETLDFVDFERIRTAPPKWYMGYSDNTNFTFLQTTLCDTASVYGPCAGSFGMEPWHPAVADALGILTGKKRLVQPAESRGKSAVNSVLRVNSYQGWERESLKSAENPLAPWNITEPCVLKCYEAGGKPAEASSGLSFEGRLLGGCMDCLVTLLGTRYDRVAEFCAQYEQDGIIWFLESCDLNVMSIRRAMWQMDRAGWFAHVRGFIIGRPLAFGQEMMGLDQYEAVMGILRRYSVPVVMDADLGHLPPSMPIVCGSMGKVQVRGNELVLDMQLK